MFGKICVVGAGYWGKNHIKTLYELGLLGGIVEENSKILKRFSNYNISLYKRLDEALENDNLLGFTVATPAETHFMIAKKIIKAEKHVLVEKPFVMSVKEAEDLIALADQNNVNLMVGHLLLFHPAIIKIKELIASGKIGNLKYIYSNRLNFGKIRNKENVLWNLAPHDFSIFQYLIESYPKKIQANGSLLLKGKIFDSVITNLEYPNGISGHVYSSWLHPFKEHRLVVIGSKGMIVFEDSSNNKLLKFYNKKVELNDGFPKLIEGEEEVINYSKKMPLTEELKHFSNSLNGGRIIIANKEHALEVTRIIIEASNQLNETLIN